MVPAETTGRIEPTWLDRPGEVAVDLVAEISAAAAALEAQLHPRTRKSLAKLVRVVESHYSHLIEGRPFRPVDIDSALESPALCDERRESLFEALAHVRVQAEIDERYREGVLGEAADLSFLRWIHRAFYEGAPESLLRIEGASPPFRMVPGELRNAYEVAVGLHQPPSSERLTDFMNYFAQRYRFEGMGRSKRIFNMATAHHRFAYIHPFPDGNGRVGRLMSHAMALAAGIGAQGLWSISRGLARGLGDRSEYKRMMNHSDMPRQGDLDGRGNLSERALREFVEWFLRVALDQIQFMHGLFEPDTFFARLQVYIERDLALRPEARAIAEHVVLRGSMARGEAARVSGLGERVARDLLATLIDRGLLLSDTPKGPVHFNVRVEAAEVLFPRISD